VRAENHRGAHIRGRETVNVQWRAEAPFLAEAYRGADAYETHNGLMAAQVTTFDESELKMKRAERR
jgi:hypothetical protein